MKLAASVAPRPFDYPSEEARYQAYSDAEFRYINYEFPGFLLSNPTGMEYMRDDWKETALAHLEKMKRFSLTPTQAHAPCCFPMPDEARAPLLAACARTIECCGVMGIPQIVLHPHAEKGMSYDRFLSENRAFFRELIPAAEKTGVLLLIENIGQFRDPHFVRDGKELRRLIEEVDHPLFGACWDTGHANHIMNDQSESIRCLGSLLKGLHVHDNLGDLMPPTKIWRVDMHTLPLFGTVNFDGIIHTLKEIGYNGYFTFESDAPLSDSRRTPFAPNGTPIAKINSVMPEIRRHVLSLTYTIGKLMLQAHDCFEE
jgi:sugar phosphate isomerase/epimerase